MRNARLPNPGLAVGHFRNQGDVAQRRRHDLAPDGEDAPRLPDGVLEVAGDLGHGHDEQVPERVAVEAAFIEAVLEQGGHQRFDVGQGRDALPEVAWGEDPVLLAQPPRAATVVGHSDDRSQVAGVLLQAA